MTTQSQHQAHFESVTAAYVSIQNELRTLRALIAVAEQENFRKKGRIAALKRDIRGIRLDCVELTDCMDRSVEERVALQERRRQLLEAKRVWQIEVGKHQMDEVLQKKKNGE